MVNIDKHSNAWLSERVSAHFLCAYASR
ncbi:uncharacterized protein METZ01_LOCUS220181, partial [marine metagenome]